MKKILFIAAHRKDRAPGQRFRFEQYFSFLEENGYQCHLSFIVTEKDDQVLYKEGHYLQKFFIALKGALKRLQEVINAREYDIIFIFREAFFTGSYFFERWFRKSGAKIVFDFDDAIWVDNISEGNKKFRWMKDSAKTPSIIALSDMVFAGNRYLADYASKYNGNVKIIPTTIDTDKYRHSGRTPEAGEPVTIGWSGSITTIRHFEYAVPFLRIIKQTYGDRVKIKVVGDRSYRNDELGVCGLAWIAEDEIKELSEFDIGIMPLPDDEWAKGKCGLKGLQYMALGIPTVMSPVGVNAEIIQDGVNGFLASSVQEWVNKLSVLIESPELRKKTGDAGLATVVEKYSVHAQKHNYLRYFNELINS